MKEADTNLDRAIEITIRAYIWMYIAYQAMLSLSSAILYGGVGIRDPILCQQLFLESDHLCPPFLHRKSNRHMVGGRHEERTEPIRVIPMMMKALPREQCPCVSVLVPNCWLIRSGSLHGR